MTSMKNFLEQNSLDSAGILKESCDNSFPVQPDVVIRQLAEPVSFIILSNLFLKKNVGNQVR